MLTLSQTLSYYKRKDVMQLMLAHAANKEVGVRFNESFGKRPDVLNYDNDILEFAKKGATSFHISEESWHNPLQLNANMRRNELDELRKGWDLILDIDCPYWIFSKLTAFLFIKALKDHKINAVTVKFSGGKGFHIGVPFEAFPEKKYYHEGKYWDVKELFPEGPRKIAEYLVHYINQSLLKIEEDKMMFGKFPVSYEKLEKETGKKRSEMIKTRCAKCNKTVENKSQKMKYEFICPHCDTRVDSDKEYMQCPNCKKLMEKRPMHATICSCGSDTAVSEFDLSSIVAVDTVLISSRHMYRMPYSLHEKTGLVSMPFDIKHILKFEKPEASTENMKQYKFLDRQEATPGEAEALFQKAFEFQDSSRKKQNENMKKDFDKSKRTTVYDMEFAQTAVPEDFFPPCIKKISQGLIDGKKRGLFVLISFLSACNWPYENIEEYVMKWNELNKPEKLRETYVRGQLRYYKVQGVKEKFPPPNCDNRGYMTDTQFCAPDNFCPKIKNPAQYAKKKAWMANNYKPKRRKKQDD